MELQGIQAELERQGWGLVAISYDSPAVLKDFSERHGITFPLLGDEGSRIITSVGVLDQDLEAHQAAFGIKVKDDQKGVAYPMVFLLASDGSVVQKRVQENYRAREGGARLLEDALGFRPALSGSPAVAEGPGLQIVARPDADSYVRYQKFRIGLELLVQEGWHLFASPAPEGCAALLLRAEPDPALALEEVRYPPAHPMSLEGLGEFPVYEGRLNLALQLAVNVPAGHGDVEVALEIRYQACSETLCEPPVTLGLTIPLREAPAV